MKAEGLPDPFNSIGETAMKLIHMTTALLLCATVSVLVGAQPSATQGPGVGPGYGKGMQFKFNQNNTRGWTLMTDQERAAHHANMISAKSYEECKARQSEQHQTLDARAKEKGVTLPAARENACDRMKAKGFFK
jgi:hypothetical protein